MHNLNVSERAVSRHESPASTHKGDILEQVGDDAATRLAAGDANNGESCAPLDRALAFGSESHHRDTAAEGLERRDFSFHAGVGREMSVCEVENLNVAGVAGSGHVAELKRVRWSSSRDRAGRA